MTKTKFNDDDEEKIIDFIKNNEILYNVKHKKFRDSEAKNRLWLKLAEELNADGECFFIVSVYFFEFFLLYTIQCTIV